MRRARQIAYPPLAFAALAVAFIAVPRPAAAQLGFATLSPQFELAENIQLDRADSSVLAQLERVKAYLGDRQWSEAVETLRHLMENSEGKLLCATERPKPGGPAMPERFVSLSDYCQLQIASLPPEALTLYRGRVDPVARKWYEDGIARRDRKFLENVVRQAFCSSWGDKALLALGEMTLESSDYTAARWNWERILPAQPPPGVRNTWPGYPDSKLDMAMVRARLVLVSILEGPPTRAREELGQFVKLHPDARGKLGGREVNYAAALGELLAQSAAWPQPQPSPDWLTFAGNAQRNNTAPESVDVGSVLWRAPLPKLLQVLPNVESPNSAVAENPKEPLSYHPALVGDRLFVANQQEVLGLRLKDGKPVWGDSTTVYRDQAEGPISSLLNPAETVGTARFTMTVHDGRLYARMGSAVTGRPQQESSSGRPGSLVCLDLQAEGKLLWKIAPEEGWAFEGSPIVDGASVYVGMRRSDIRTQAHVACFDAQTGRLRWRRFVCGAETPARGLYHQSTHNLLTMEGRTLYYNTNLGAVAALGANDGRLLWVSLYPRQRKGDSQQLAPHWHRDLNPCLVHQGTLLVAPADSPRIFCLDACTGQILWQTGPEVEDAVHLLGVAGDCLLAGGRKLYWIRFSGEKRGWIKHVWPDGPEKPGFGRGLLADGRVLWPTRQKIMVFDSLTAQPKKVVDLAPLGITGGNLLVAAGRLVVATGSELIVLSGRSGEPSRTNLAVGQALPDKNRRQAEPDLPPAALRQGDRGAFSRQASNGMAEHLSRKSPPTPTDED
jgi:outer membrane protein assembly factor BamB